VADDDAAKPKEPTALAVVVDRKEVALCQEIRNVTDMTATAANAQTEVARWTYGVPARQETLRTVSIAAAVIVIAGIAAKLLPPDMLKSVLQSAVYVLGGGWTVGQAIEKFRKKPPAPPDSA
jgi:hypothetical protein